MRQFLLYLSIAITVAACKKDKAVPTDTTPQLSPLEVKKQKLMNARWRLEKMETIVLVNGDSMTFDITPQNGCGTDDLLEYHSSGFIKIHTGTILCYSGQPPLDTLKAWSMPNEQQIMETHLDNNYDQYWDIEALDEEILRISTGTVDTNGNQRNTITYTNVQ